MMCARLLLALVVLLSFALTVLADPPTYCAPVEVDAFAVTAATSGDSEGVQLMTVNGSYPTQRYYAAVPRGYVGPSIFFRVRLTNNGTAGTGVPANSTVGVQFTMSLNGVYNLNSAGLPQVYAAGVNGVQDVEMFNWSFILYHATNNTVLINVTESIVSKGDVGADINTCSYVYQIIILNPAIVVSGLVTGDPQFVGLRGQSFQVHGIDGAVYNLISDRSMQLNSRFTFLDGPRPCPVMPSTGEVSAACWSHPGSYLSELALKTIGGSKLHIVSGSAKAGFSSVTLDGTALTIGATAKLSFADSGLTGSISVDSSHELSIHAGHFDLVVENNDGFVNLRHVSVLAASWSKLASHGLLGQTWQNKRHSGKVKEIEGDVDDYMVDNNDMFGDVFLFNRFAAQ